MEVYKTDQLRNVALIGHSSSGKTTLAEAMLFNTGATSRRGRVEDGTTVSDWDDEAIRRKISVSASVVPCEWQGHKLNVLDTPGFIDFAGETKSAVAWPMRPGPGGSGGGRRGRHRAGLGLSR